MREQRLFSVDRADDAEERIWARFDYAWLVRTGDIIPTPAAWQAFRDGYRAGGQIGRRHFHQARRAAAVPYSLPRIGKHSAS